jgi:hypothetical protein
VINGEGCASEDSILQHRMMPMTSHQVVVDEQELVCPLFKERYVRREPVLVHSFTQPFSSNL